MRINTRSISLAATLTALCAVFGFIPYVFFLPVMVACTTLSLGAAAFVGFAFGCVSLAYSFIMPTSLVSMAFVQAPYIAIVPRILAALGSYGMFVLIMRLFKPQKRGARAAATAVSAATGSLLNTALVVSLLVLIMPNSELGGVTMIAYVPNMLISGAIECVAMAALTPPIALTLKKTVLRDRTQKPVTVRGSEEQAAAVDEPCVTAESADNGENGASANTVCEDAERSDKTCKKKGAA